MVTGFLRPALLGFLAISSPCAVAGEVRVDCRIVTFADRQDMKVHAELLADGGTWGIHEGAAAQFILRTIDQAPGTETEFAFTASPSDSPIHLTRMDPGSWTVNPQPSIFPPQQQVTFQVSRAASAYRLRGWFAIHRAGDEEQHAAGTTAPLQSEGTMFDAILSHQETLLVPRGDQLFAFTLSAAK